MERGWKEFDAIVSDFFDVGADAFDGVVRGGVAFAGQEEQGDARGQGVGQGGEAVALAAGQGRDQDQGGQVGDAAFESRRRRPADRPRRRRGWRRRPAPPRRASPRSARRGCAGRAGTGRRPASPRSFRASHGRWWACGRWRRGRGGRTRRRRSRGLAGAAARPWPFRSVIGSSKSLADRSFS